MAIKSALLVRPSRFPAHQWTHQGLPQILEQNQAVQVDSKEVENNQTPCKSYEFKTINLFKLHRHRPQIASTHPNCQKNTRKELSICDHEERQGGSGGQEQPRMEIMKGAAQNGDHEGRQMKGDKAAAASRPFGDFRDQQPSHWEVRGNKWRREILEISMQGDKWRETNEEGRLGAAAISVISMQGDWESACRETNEGRQLKRRWFWESACRETKEGRQMKRRWFWESARRERNEGRQMKKGDFGNQHAGTAGRQMKGDKWRRETRSGSDFGNQHAGRQMKGDKWRRETRSGSDFGNQHAGRQMKGDKWRRETRSGSVFGNQQPNLWEVRTPIASSYLGKNQGMPFGEFYVAKNFQKTTFCGSRNIEISVKSIWFTSGCFPECVAKGSRRLTLGVWGYCFRVRNCSQPTATARECSNPSPMALPLGRALKSDFSWISHVSLCIAIPLWFASEWYVMQERWWIWLHRRRVSWKLHVCVAATLGFAVSEWRFRGVGSRCYIGICDAECLPSS